ncbi:protein LKAAEAR1 [Latimeria chalumnae]|uniref:protein LKAAEAR1 n=1 Tax=Latimeria chalumnae TaxID=7897 RepID=UPI0006D8F1A9|nr:PREDICTED: protein LKAAEAR1 [Latimeria chalumnae]|eukprot:XP_014353620.1 PREDICTED: protein LKAAEAR1 [Latimeria chalumnae]
MAEKDSPTTKEKFVPKNWKTFTAAELKKLNPQQRAKYVAYEEPNKEVAATMLTCLKRLKDQEYESKKYRQAIDEEALLQRKDQEKLIGQLKAAEARNRLRLMRMRFQALRAQEINHLIACQPTARKAVRLEAFLPPQLDMQNPGDTIDKLERQRIEQILGEDSLMIW